MPRKKIIILSSIVAVLSLVIVVYSVATVKKLNRLNLMKDQFTTFLRKNEFKLMEVKQHLSKISKPTFSVIMQLDEGKTLIAFERENPDMNSIESSYAVLYTPKGIQGTFLGGRLFKAYIYRLNKYEEFYNQMTGRTFFYPVYTNPGENGVAGYKKGVDIREELIAESNHRIAVFEKDIEKIKSNPLWFLKSGYADELPENQDLHLLNQEK